MIYRAKESEPQGKPHPAQPTVKPIFFFKKEKDRTIGKKHLGAFKRRKIGTGI